VKPIKEMIALSAMQISLKQTSMPRSAMLQGLTFDAASRENGSLC
jgi:hypothetical protein